MKKYLGSKNIMGRIITVGQTLGNRNRRKIRIVDHLAHILIILNIILNLSIFLCLINKAFFVHSDVYEGFFEGVKCQVYLNGTIFLQFFENINQFRFFGVRQSYHNCIIRCLRINSASINIV